MNGIKYVRRSQIDIILWDKCIAQSSNSKIYAFSWYLDSMVEHWSALILGDYQAVMPLPWKSKFGLRYIYHPPFIQQLGVFSANIDVNIFDFIAEIPTYFVKVDYLFSSNLFDDRFQNYATRKKNFVLNLNQSFSKIENGYRDTLKRNLKSAEKNGCKIGKLGLEGIPLVINMYREAYGKHFSQFDDEVFERFGKMMHICFEKQIGSIYLVLLPTNTIVAIYFIINDLHRIYYLMGAPTTEGKNSKAIPFLINKIIEENAEKALIFDFEGSEIASVASFYEKFNPETEYYYLIKYYNLLGWKIRNV
ncbi:MAG: hypothetical protein ACKVOU_08090 [Cytophagales bacterium]